MNNPVFSIDVDASNAYGIFGGAENSIKCVKFNKDYKEDIILTSEIPTTG